jgi:RimJ/RimL family protein N-acetyltransferase
MRSSEEWPAATRIHTRRLILEPLRVGHADEMVFVLGDAALYEFTGGAPPTLEELRTRYARQVSGRSPDRTQGWLNWIVREQRHLTAVGAVQATLLHDGKDMVANVAWVIGMPYQRRGYATEAAKAIVAGAFARERLSRRSRSPRADTAAVRSVERARFDPLRYPY